MVKKEKQLKRKYIIVSVILLGILGAAAYHESLQERPLKYEIQDATRDEVRADVLHLEYPPTKLREYAVKRTDKTYIANNLIAFDVESDDFTPLAAIDGRLDDYTIYISGEHHGVKANTDVNLYLTKYLYETQGVRYLLLERGYGVSQLFNQYIQTGDEDLLNKTFELSPTSMSWYNEEGYQFLKDLYEFNRGLPDQAKITLLGFDIAYELNCSVYYLRTLLPDQPPPEDIKKNIDLLRNVERDHHQYVPIMDMYYEIQSKEHSYREFLGADFFNFQFTIQNMVQSYTCGKEPNARVSDFHLYREDAIIKNFTELIEHYDIQKGYAHSGAYHANYNNKGFIYWVVDYTLGSYLWHDYPRTREKVYGIEILYDNCKAAYTKGPVSSNFIAKKTDYPIDTNSVFIDYTGENTPMRSIYDYGAMAFVVVYDSPECTTYKPR